MIILALTSKTEDKGNVIPGLVIAGLGFIANTFFWLKYKKIAKETDLIQNDVAQVVQKTLDYIAAELVAGRTIELRNFGVFEIKVRKSRKGRNPNQPENEVVIPERAVVKFRAGKELKDAVEKLNPADFNE